MPLMSIDNSLAVCPRSNVLLRAMVIVLVVIAAMSQTLSAHAGGGGGEAGGAISVVSVAPGARTVAAARNATITVTFDRPVNPATVTTQSFWAFGRSSGAADGEITYSNGNATVSLAPAHAFAAGEQVLVILSHDIRGADGSSLRAAGFSWQFTVATRPANLQFTQAQSFSVRSVANQQTQAYGGIGADFNNDHWLDLGVINEISADLRVFLNRADDTGTFHPMLLPPAPLDFTASPSETSDFNRDGETDVAVGNQGSGTISILFGDGDGTFTPRPPLDIGMSPYGVVVLDADGDGDADIANTNYGANGSLSISLNNGSGGFGPPNEFEGGVVGERGLATADMNNDGILDLVVGGWNSEQVAILTGDGDGTFTLADVQDCGGESRIVVCGDVNGDGHDDVASGNGHTNNASILLGNGAGALGAATVYRTTPFTGPTRLGDFDGDGDLDWIISCFSGDWQLMLNNGSGVFSLNQSFEPNVIASCSTPMDIDNDGDLDLALIDEVADIVRIMKNSGTAIVGDCTGDGLVNVADLLSVITNWGACAAPCPADINGDGTVNVADLLAVITNWG